MASVSKQDGKDEMANELAPEADGPIEPRPPRAATEKTGFFTLYKPGQGYWTRMLTAGGAILVIALTAHFLYNEVLRVEFRLDQDLALGVTAGFAAVAFAILWWAMNRPNSAEFLIATDGEMKKVNWTSRKELIGSTKVVIGFMFMIAFLLFGIDTLFGYLFYFIDVLKFRPL